MTTQGTKPRAKAEFQCRAGVDGPITIYNIFDEPGSLAVVHHHLNWQGLIEAVSFSMATRIGKSTRRVMLSVSYGIKTPSSAFVSIPT